jgi:Bacterial SH3 domain
MMNRTLRIAFMFVGITIALPALGGETSPVKCTAGQDRVWVYDSLSNLGVQTKVKCGDRVEIVAREKGFVKVRTQDGTEGYVPEDALPKPAPAPANDSNNNSEKPAADNSLAAQARAYRAARAAASAPAAANAAPAPVAAIPKIEKASEARASAAQPQPQVSSVQPAIVSSISIEPVNAATKTAAAVKSNESAGGNRIAASSQPAVNVSSINVVASSEAGSAPAPVPASQKNDKAAVTAAKKPKTAPAPPASKPARPAPTATSTSTTSSASTAAPAAPASARSFVVASNATSEAPRAVAAVETTNLSVSGKSPATLQPVPNASTHTVAATSSDTDSEDYPERLIEDESASAACQVYFSAYGLSPNQYKWIAENRRKKYPGICPAPGPAKVDFVVIFTHDVEFYNSTMPAAVHTDKNGFSDFTPLTTADNALLSASELDKSHHEYVWVFQMKRGTFDPAKFSPRRRPQFTKTESNGLGSHGGGPRTVEDAFRFIEEGAPAR